MSILLAFRDSLSAFGRKFKNYVNKKFKFDFLPIAASADEKLLKVKLDMTRETE
jgi:hypothetical protein